MPTSPPITGSAPNAGLTHSGATQPPTDVRRSRRPDTRVLHDGWTLHSLPLHPGGAGIPAIPAIPATVPGCVHTDLVAAGIITEPRPPDELTADELTSDGQAALAWVADADWRYVRRLDDDLLDAMRHHEHVELVCDGLDTLATVRLGDRVVATTANMHRRHRFDITPEMRERRGIHGMREIDTNAAELSIDFVSVTRAAIALRQADSDAGSDADGHGTATSADPAHHQFRKMACSWGWDDWDGVPSLPTAGIWRPIRLHGWSTARLGHVRTLAQLTRSDDLDRYDRPRGPEAIDAELVGQLEVQIPLVASARTDADRRPVAVRCTLVDPAGHPVADRTVTVAPTAEHAAVVDLRPGMVEPWWPRSLGDQPLYRLSVILSDADGAELDRWSTTVGFRTIELDTSADEIGAQFTFVVNGIPIFARGVTWIPDDVVPSRVSHQQLRARLTQACEANVDLVRVWGGGLYEDDHFYDLCDELGLLVWQDMAFAGAPYPEARLRDEVRAEVGDNMLRLHHHPSLALWNGNADHARSSRGTGFFLEDIPAVIDELDPTTPYWPGSPYSGPYISPNADTHGCTHVWDAWHALDHERYRDHCSRFVSEFGWQARPTMGVPEHSTVERPNLRHSPATHLRREAPDEADRRRFAAELSQARAARTGIEHFRSLRGWCMGTVWWRFNDGGPTTGWSLVDRFGRRAPAWYALRDAYADRLVTVQPRGHDLVVCAIDDGPHDDGRGPWRATGTASRLRLDGTVLRSQRIDLVVSERSVARQALDPLLISPGDPTDEVLVVDIDGRRTTWWFAPDREVRLRAPRLDGRLVHVDATPGCALLSVTSDVVVRDLVIRPERSVTGATIDRQLVTLLPGVPQHFTITGLDTTVTAEQLLRQPITWSAADLAARR